MPHLLYLLSSSGPFWYNAFTETPQLLKTKHVNIFDVIEARDAHTVVAPDLIFDNVRDLARYSRRNNKVFPRVQAKKDGLLNLMLRQIG